MTPDRLDRRLAELQAEWLAGAWGRLLRRIAVARCRQTLEIGSGCGLLAETLQRRTSGAVTLLDRSGISQLPAGARGVRGAAEHLPFSDGCFDLVVTQCTLLWVGDVGEALVESFRVLQPGGWFLAVEPDYGGMMEWPPQHALRDVWLDALTRAGADPMVGRSLPARMRAAGFYVETRLLDRIPPAAPGAIRFLRDLPLDAQQRRRADAAAGALQDPQQPLVSHLPFWLLAGRKMG